MVFFIFFFFVFYEFSPDVPKSDLIYSDNLDCVTSFCKLYEKYMSSSSHYALNVSSDCINELGNLYQNLNNLTQLDSNNNDHLDDSNKEIPLNIFNKVIYELFDNLQDSMHRFKLTKEYKELEIIQNTV